MNKERPDMGDNKEDIFEYRLTQVEKAVSDLTIIKSTVLKMEAKLESFGAPNCALHNQRMLSLEKKCEDYDQTLDTLKAFKVKVLVYGSIAMLLLQLFGPSLVKTILPQNQPAITHVQK